jgi:hypothetical protein
MQHTPGDRYALVGGRLLGSNRSAISALHSCLLEPTANNMLDRGGTAQDAAFQRHSVGAICFAIDTETCCDVYSPL